jgi:hypothetical protein
MPLALVGFRTKWRTIRRTVAEEDDDIIVAENNKKSEGLGFDDIVRFSCNNRVEQNREATTGLITC